MGLLEERVDLRVGRVLRASRHEEAEKLVRRGWKLRSFARIARDRFSGGAGETKVLERWEARMGTGTDARRDSTRSTSNPSTWVNRRVRDRS